MNLKILIPTKGRVNNQITFNILPKKWQQQTKLVVCIEEYEKHCELYGKDNVIVRSKEASNSIALTREWIYKKYKNDKFIVFDDDLIFEWREPNDINKKPKWLRHKLKSEEFDTMFDLINNIT